MAPEEGGGVGEAARLGAGPPDAPRAADGCALARSGREGSGQQPALRPPPRPPDLCTFLGFGYGFSLVGLSRRTARAWRARVLVGGRGGLRGGGEDGQGLSGCRSLQGGLGPLRG